MAVGDPIPAHRRIDGMYGEARRDGKFLADVIAVTGTVTIDKREIVMAGSVGTHNKRGRVSRDGSIRYQQVDSRWLEEFLAFTSLSLAERRAARDRGESPAAPFNITLIVDDPEAFGAEEVELEEVVMWAHDIGFDITALLEREVPISWSNERLIKPIVQPT